MSPRNRTRRCALTVAWKKHFSRNSVTATSFLLDLPYGCFTSVFAVFLIADVQGSGCSKAASLVSALSCFIVCFSAAAAIAVELLTMQTFVYQSLTMVFFFLFFLVSLSVCILIGFVGTALLKNV